MRNQRKRVLGKPRPCPQGTCLVVFFLLLVSLPCYKHLELTLPKQRALGHLTAGDDPWEQRAAALEGLLRSLTLGKEDFGVLSTAFAKLFFGVSAVSPSRVAAAGGLEQSWLPLAWSLYGRAGRRCREARRYQVTSLGVPSKREAGGTIAFS